ncbi:MAG: ferrous iron transport protein [Proteobacteria bacterium]|jgi:ferrous iron transport protein A|nr:ferrous iron transport protein [Pseudomonadota bacterium]
MNQSAAPSLTLAQLDDYQACIVERIAAPPGAPEWHDWLEEIGFLPGERAMVMNRALPGGDPLVVRVGNSTFALRRIEAACVQVTLDETAS